MPTPQLDGSLVAWPDLAPSYSEAVLLCGNGLGVNVWPAFAYASLFDQARGGGLTKEDLALFGGTENFERVLSDLNTAIRVNETVGQPADPIYERYRSIQRGLGHAVRAVHLTRSQVSDATLRAIRAEMLRYEWIFSTSYDLLLYWAMGCGGSFTPFIDHFRGPRLEFDPSRADVYVDQAPVYFLHDALHLVAGGSGGASPPFNAPFRGPRLVFDPSRADVYVDQVPVYFLHGALHLVVGGSGVTSKLRRSAMQTVLR